MRNSFIIHKRVNMCRIIQLPLFFLLLQDDKDYKYVTGSEKTAHFAQDFKIELLVLTDE